MNPTKTTDPESNQDPYQTPKDLPNKKQEIEKKRKWFPYFLIGILPGAFVGPTYFLGYFFILLVHGEVTWTPAESLGIPILVISFVTGILGMIYSGVLAIISYAATVTYRLHAHFWFAMAASFGVATSVTELNLSYRMFLSPIIGVAIVFLLMAMFAISTAQPRSTYGGRFL